MQKTILKPLISIIIPVFNGEKYLRDALDTVVTQSYAPVEVLVVDDGSTDQTAKIVHSYDGVSYIYQPHQGVAAARNAGISASYGECIAFLDADDQWASDKLNIQVEYLLARPEMDAVFAKVRHFLEEGMKPPAWLRKQFLFVEQNGFFLGTLLARNRVFQQIGGFNTTYKRVDDVDWFIRARDRGVCMDMLPDILLYRRVHNTNMSAKPQEFHAELLRVLRTSIRRKHHMAKRMEHKSER